MSKTITAEKAIRDVRTQAEKIRSDRPQRFPEAASPGDYWRQGDIYITLLAAVPQTAEKVQAPASRQLAPGDTQGSRHCLDSLDGADWHRLKQATEFDGPILALATERTVTHPEHGHVILPPGVYAITYQRNLDQEEREARVQD